MNDAIKNKPVIGVKAPFAPLQWRYSLVWVGAIATLLIFAMAGAFASFPGDLGALEGLRSNRSGWLDSAALGVTKLGGFAVAGALMLGLILALAFARRRTDALVVLISVVPIIFGLLLKEAVGRARPEFLVIGPEPDGLSFPSGHALFAMIFGGILIILSNELIQSIRLRRAVQIGLVLLILAIGASRVYLGVHFPSDVLGSYLYGGMALLGIVSLRKWFASRNAGKGDAPA